MAKEEKENLIAKLYAKENEINGIQMLLLGAPGLGKTTFAISGAPTPLIIDLEGGAKRYKRLNAELKRVDASGAKWEQLMAILDVALGSPHATIILDTADAAAEMLRQHLYNTFNINIEKDSLMSAGRGYGHAFDVMSEHWRKMIAKLSAITAAGKHVCVICHVDDKEVTKPNQRPYTAQVIRLPKRIAPLLSEWAEIIGHLDLEASDSGDQLNSTKKRLLHVSPDLHVLAKNRFLLPDPTLVDSDFGKLLKLIDENN